MIGSGKGKMIRVFADHPDDKQLSNWHSERRTTWTESKNIRDYNSIPERIDGRKTSWMNYIVLVTRYIRCL